MPNTNTKCQIQIQKAKYKMPTSGERDEAQVFCLFSLLRWQVHSSSMSYPNSASHVFPFAILSSFLSSPLSPDLPSPPLSTQLLSRPSFSILPPIPYHLSLPSLYFPSLPLPLTPFILLPSAFSSPLSPPPPSHLMFPRGAERSHWYVWLLPQKQKRRTR